MVKFEEDPDISTEEGYGTEDIDVIDTEVEIEEDPDIRTEEGYGNIDPSQIRRNRHTHGDLSACGGVAFLRLGRITESDGERRS